jgi:hypothetical protein
MAEELLQRGAPANNEWEPTGLILAFFDCSTCLWVAWLAKVVFRTRAAAQPWPSGAPWNWRPVSRQMVEEIPGDRGHLGNALV